MSKVICDICGTTYPDTADQCPICGCSRELGGMLSAEMMFEEPKSAPAAAPAKGGRFAAKKEPKRSKKPVIYYEDDEDDDDEEADEYEDEEEYQEDFASDDDYEEDDDYEDDDEYEDEYDDEEEDARDSGDSIGTKVFLVVFLLLVITAMLAVTGFLFFRYFLPNQGPAGEETVATTEATVTETEESTVPTVPCVSLALTGGAPSLTFEGQNWLLNVVTVPEDTTDVLSYRSADESVVTVTEQGRVTAVGEGETLIYITCGNITMECNVTVAYTEETQPSEETGEEATGETTEEQTEPEETEPEETKELLDIDLWCNYSDMTLSYRGETVTLKVNQQLSLEDLEWTSKDPAVATVENGVIKGVGHGKTEIIGKYGDQEVVIIVRCAFW